MKNITLSADDHLIDLARQRAKSRHQTLNQAFREWLTDYTRDEDAGRIFDEFYRRIAYVDSGGKKFTREELNER
ncbi:MAG TPA: hypothetical protein VEF06_09805 [Bryobacteraceae bacterium]|nr:hypothetical protein [Bryobacteraceae bacterium]